MRQIITLRHMNLEPELLRCPPNTLISIKIAHNSSFSSEQSFRKFLFLLEETDEESPGLQQGGQFSFSIPLLQAGTYTLQCLNYPKIRCSIRVQSEESMNQVQQQKVVSIGSQLSAVVQQKQEELKQSQQLREYEKNIYDQKSELANYQRILNDEEVHYDYVPNKYLQYFKEQFKLWRDFFETPQPLKQKSRDKTSSSFSLSQRQSQKQSVISHLRSQQEISDLQEEETNQNKIMKKTNSQYCLNVERDNYTVNLPSGSKRKHINTNASSPGPRTEYSDTDSFVQWACNWAESEKLEEIKIPRIGDKYLVQQWFTYLQNSTIYAIQSLKLDNLCIAEENEEYLDR